MIEFNKPYFSGKETHYINDAIINEQHISGNGKFTKLCHQFFEKRYGFKKCLLTTSCTDALEMAAILCNIQPGDEVIVPSFTFVSTANAFVLRGAHIVFAESRSDHPGIDEDHIEELITPYTKVIVPVHYAGVACNMEKIMALSEKYNLFVVEDAAQAIDSFYVGKDGFRKPLGSIGHFGCFSFHETKNIQCGEGGMLVINDERFFERAEIIWEKGTNRAEFFRGEVDKYNWIDIGSSYLPSDIIAAFLLAQTEILAEIQKKRNQIWEKYYESLKPLLENGRLSLPVIPDYATKNAHIFFLICNSLEERNNLISYLKQHEILAIFHYMSLHKSPYYLDKYYGKTLPNCVHFSECLVRLPLYYELKNENQDFVISIIKMFFLNKCKK